MEQQQHRFHDIEQFRMIVKTVKDRAEHHKVIPPKLTFHGTVKLHGMNMSVVFPEGHKFYTQSRETIITPDNDVKGFAKFANNCDFQWKILGFCLIAKEIYYLRNNNVFKRPHVDIIIYGEWCGKEIYTSTAIGQLNNNFIIFAVKIITSNKKITWLTPLELKKAFSQYDNDSYIKANEYRLYCIEEFKTYQIEIDFSNPESSIEELTRITTEVELECPVAAELGIKGTGEGVVWTCDGGDHTPIRTDDLIFKVKGEKHSDTKNSSICSVDIERRNSIEELASSFITDHRLEKGINYLFECGTNNIYDIGNIGHFLKWVGGDIIKEETDTIIGNGFEVKELTKAVNILAKKWFLDKAGIKK